MSDHVFLMLPEDRLMIRADAIVALEELDEQDIDPRSGRLALGIPEGSVAKVVTEHATFYTKTTYDELMQAVMELAMDGAR